MLDGRRSLIGLALTAWVTWSGAALAPAETLTYTLSPDFKKGRTRVELIWATQGRERSTLRLAGRWGQIEDVAKLLRDVSVDGAQFRRNGQLWELEHRKNAEIRVRYDVDAGRRNFGDWAFSHHPVTTRSFFHAVGNAFLMTPNVGSGMPPDYEVILRWQLGAGEKGVCSWGYGRTVGARLRVDDLRESVYLAGDIQTKQERLAGRTLTVAMIDAFDFSIDEFTRMTNDIIKRQCAFMQDTQFPDFVVTAIPVGEPLQEGEARLSGSGLYQSFSLCLAPKSRLTDAVEHLFAHELFHHWNGRLLAARQPERLVYWFIEGFTDYYALRILYDSGYWDARTYVKWLNRHLREYALNPARNASNERIERDYWNERDTVGEAAYQRGLLLGLRWRAMAEKNGQPEGLDRLFRLLVNRGRTEGFQVTNDAIRAAGAELLGPWFKNEFDQYVTRAETIDVPPDALAAPISGAMEMVYKLDLGLDVQRSLAAKVARGVRPDGPAAKAGLREGDELLAWKTHGDTDRPVQLKVRRGERAVNIEYLPRGQSAAVLQFRVRQSGP